MNGRLKQFIEYAGITTSAFEKVCGLSNGAVNKINRGTRQTTLDKISNAYPQLNINWLLTGEGDMIRNDETSTTNITSTSAKPYYGSLPVSAGRVIQYPDILVQSATGTINIPQTHGAEMFFPVIGMSMKPSIDEGEIIGVAHVDCYETTNADRIYMIVTRDGERMIKRILKYDKERGLVILGSDNPQYPNTELSVDMIMDIYKVMFHMKIETL